MLLDNSHDETFLSQLPDSVRAEALALRREREERHAAAAAQREAMQRELESARSLVADWTFSRNGGPGGVRGAPQVRMLDVLCVAFFIVISSFAFVENFIAFSVRRSLDDIG